MDDSESPEQFDFLKNRWEKSSNPFVHAFGVLLDTGFGFLILAVVIGVPLAFAAALAWVLWKINGG